MRKYTNYKKFLESIDFKLETTLDDFEKTNDMSFRCPKNHKTDIKGTSFANKKALHKNDHTLLCTECKKLYDNKFFFDKYSEEILKTGHILLTLDPDTRKCTYECGNCGEIKDTYIQNLRKESTTEYCSSCIQIQNRNSIEDVNNILKEFGYMCIKYKNNKEMTVKCDKGHVSSTLKLYDYNRGRRCPFCKNKTEEKVYRFLSEHYNTKYQFIPEWCKNTETNRYSRYDFVLTDYNIIIELDGKQHFEQLMTWEPYEETRKKDVLKMIMANKNNYHVIRVTQKEIWFDSYDWKEYLQTKIKYLLENNEKYTCIFPEEKEGCDYIYKYHVEEYNKAIN